MMLQHALSITMLLLTAELATGLQQGYGWLDKVVQFQKKKLFNEVQELAPINMNVELRQKSEGYEDSRHWDYHSVSRLLSLIRTSETAKPVYKALRRMLQPTRRIMMSIKQSKQRFPSLKQDDNNIYYDMDYTSKEENAGPPAPPVPEDQAVIVVSNPVEARLPSARISVKLLREILEARARAARQMPTTTATTPWMEFLKNRTSTQAGSTDATTKATEDSESTTAAEVETGAESDEATTGVDEETTSAENTPEEITSDEITSAETTSEEITSEETTPGEIASEATTPGEITTTPATAAPEQ